MSRLVERLLRLTLDSKLDWKTEHTEGHELLVAVVRGIEYVVGAVDNDGRPPFFLTVWRTEPGVSLARLESQPPDEDAFGNPVALTAAQKIPELWAAATRSASGTPQIFGELMDALDMLDPDDPPPF